MIAGPFLVGSGFRRNQAANSPFMIAVNNAVPAGALLAFLMGTDAPDTVEMLVSDTAGNEYFPQVNLSMDPGTGFCASMYFGLQPGLAKPLSITDTISLQCSERASLGGAMYYFTGAEGHIWACMVRWSSEWGNSANVYGEIPCLPDMSVMATLAIAGPNNDVFNQDPNGWSADLTAGAGNFNATVHATAKHNLPTSQPVSYAPVLGTARRAVLAMFSFK